VLHERNFQNCYMKRQCILDVTEGPMNKKEIGEFERNPNLDQIITVRYLDDIVKI